MKKAFSAIIAILLCMIFVFAGCKNVHTTPGSLVDNSEQGADNEVQYLQSDVKIQEGETTYEEQLGKGVDTFLSGTYCLDGTIYSDGDAVPVVLSFDGDNKNIEIMVDLNPLNFGVLILDDSTYVVLPTAKKYTELSNTLLSAIGLGDTMSVADLDAIRHSGADADEDAKRVQTAVTINGTPGLCTEYVYDDTIIRLYSIGDELIQVENYDENNKLTMQIVVNSITDQIPADHLTLKGFSKVSVSAFLASMLSVS